MLKWRLRSHIWVTSLAVALAVLIATPRVARAECFVELDAPDDAACVVTRWKERAGVWFDLNSAERIRQLEEEAPHLRDQALLLETTVALREEQIRLYVDALQQHEQSSEEHRRVRELLERETLEARTRQLEEERRSNAWYRSPILWFSVGVVGAVAAGFALTKVVD
jgi:hypothetical protein